MIEDDDDEPMTLATAGDETTPQMMLEVYREQARQGGHMPMAGFAELPIEDRFELLLHMVVTLNRMMMQMVSGEEMQIGPRSAADILKKTSN